jgi:hypothetical protein
MFRKVLVAAGLLAACAPAAQAQITPRPEVLTGAFTPGFVGEADEKRYPVRTIRIGELQISSGRVIVVDPFLMSTRDRPLTVSVPPGRYPVDLAVADAGGSGQRVALARLLISDIRSSVTGWTPEPAPSSTPPSRPGWKANIPGRPGLVIWSRCRGPIPPSFAPTSGRWIGT